MSEELRLRLAKVFGTLSGSDKVLKFTSGVAKVLAFHLAASKSPNAGAWARLASALGQGRKTFRCTQDIPQINKLQKILQSKSLGLFDYCLQTCQVVNYMTFIFVDHLLLASSLNFFASDKARWLRISCMGWFWSCVSNCLIELRSLQKHLSQLQELSASNEELLKSRTACREHILAFVQNASDAVCASILIGYDVKMFGRKLTSRTYGWGSMISGALAFRLIYKKS